MSSKRKSIARRRRVPVDAISESTVDALYEILCGVYTGFTREMFANDVLRRDGSTRVTLLYGREDELAGFITQGVARYELFGRTHAVLDFGVIIDLDYRGGGEQMAIVAISTALAYKLRHPRQTLGALCKATSPALYRLLASSGQTFPHPFRDTPAEITELVRTLKAHKGYDDIDGDPWRVPAIFPMRFATPSKVATPRDPYEALYFERNPSFRAGDILLAYMPINLRSLAESAYLCAGKALAYRLRKARKPRSSSSTARSHIPAGNRPPR